MVVPLLLLAHISTAACSRVKDSRCQIVRRRSRAPTTTAIEEGSHQAEQHVHVHTDFVAHFVRFMDEPLTHRKQTCQRQACEPGTLTYTDTDRLARLHPQREPPAYERHEVL